MPRIPPKCCPGFIPGCKGYGRFLLCPHALEYSLRTCTMRVHQRLAGWAARAQQRGRGRCTHAHAHSGIQAPGCGDASRFALYLEDSAEPLKTGGEGARQDLPGTLAARVPPPPTGCRVCSFRSFSDAPFTWNHVYAGPGRGQETHRRRSYYTCCLHLVLFFI